MTPTKAPGGLVSQPSAGDARGQRLALAAVGVTMLLWASAFVGIRAAAPYFSFGALALGRLFVASVVLVAILLIRREGLPPRAAWPAIAGAGALWFALYQITLNWGEQHIDAGTAAMLIGIAPIVVAVVSGTLLGERISRNLVVGLAIAVVGTVLIGLSVAGSADDSLLGVLLCVIAAFSTASGVLLQKPALRRASPGQVTTFGCLVGMVVSLPFAGQLVGELAVAPTGAILNVLYLGIFPTALAFSTWAYALARTSASVAGATTFVIPAIVIALSWSVLGEVPGWLAIVGGALCLVGVGLSRRRDRVAEPAAETAQAPPTQVPPTERR
jgi:drug/metabolite transporter (DMT)-like permease